MPIVVRMAMAAQITSTTLTNFSNILRARKLVVMRVVPNSSMPSAAANPVASNAQLPLA